MVMAIVGGGIVTPVLGFVQGSSAGAAGVVCVLLACLAYLFALGLFAGRKSSVEK
jgi:fucose permease